MPTPPLPDDLRRPLAEPNPAVMATLRKDGRPVTVATWYLFEGDRILVNLQEDRTRLQHLRSDPRVALTVLDSKSWYTHVSVQGHVAEIVDDVDLADIDRIARHYIRDAYPVRDRERVSVWIEIDTYHAWNTTS
jgi:PPOX class probable F420-dependent enzyme